MQQWIRVHNESGKAIIVNAQQICFIATDDERTVIQMPGDARNFLLVRESEDDIIAMILAY